MPEFYFRMIYIVIFHMWQLRNEAHDNKRGRIQYYTLGQNPNFCPKIGFSRPKTNLSESKILKYLNFCAENSDKMAQNHILIQIEFKDKNWIFAPVCSTVVITYQFSSFLFLGFLLPTFMNIRFKTRDGVATDDIFRIEHLHQIIDVRCG